MSIRKKFFLFICLLLIGLYIFTNSFFREYMHTGNIINETGYPIIIHDSPFIYKGIEAKTLYLDNRSRSSHIRRGSIQNGGDFKYSRFNWPDEATIVWQKARVECKVIPFSNHQDCKFIPASETLHRQTLNLKAMRQTKLGRKAGKLCGPFCGRHVMNTRIIIHPDIAPQPVTVELKRQTRGGTVW